MKSLDLAQTIRLMIDAGCDTEQIKRVCDGHADQEQTKRETQRAKWREVKQKQRLSTLSKKNSVDIVDLSPPSSPPDGFPPAVYTNKYTPPSLTPSSSPTHSRVREGFDRFWQIYPRKTGKGAAEKSWAKAAASTAPDEIIDRAAAYRWPDDPQFIPHPATWLNQKRWLDEPASQAPQKETLSQYYARLAMESEQAESNVYSLRRN